MDDGTIQHIVWDWNGTLLDDVTACVSSINEMLRVRGLAQLTVDVYRDTFEFPVRNYYDALGFNLEAEDWDAVAREFHANSARFSPEAPLRNEVRPALDRLRGRGVPMSVLSASEISLLERMMRERHVRDYFDHVYGLDDLYARSKMDEGRALLREVALPPDSILLVGDTTHDFDVAQELGFRCVLITGGHGPERKLRQCGCPVHAGFTWLFDMPAPVCNTPGLPEESL